MNSKLENGTNGALCWSRMIAYFIFSSQKFWFINPSKHFFIRDQCRHLAVCSWMIAFLWWEAEICEFLTRRASFQAAKPTRRPTTASRTPARRPNASTTSCTGQDPGSWPRRSPATFPCPRGRLIWAGKCLKCDCSVNQQNSMRYFVKKNYWLVPWSSF